MPSIYLASPLGFSPEFKGYRARIKERLIKKGLVVLDPWDNERSAEFARRLASAACLTEPARRNETCRELAREIGEHNERLIEACDILLAVLDGMEPDSGTAAELGFASALGKRCYGLRTDMRTAGDFEGVAINLQLIRFIERNGGRLLRSLGELESITLVDQEQH